MRLTVVVAVLSVLGLISGVLAFNEPDGFRGVPWGATEEQMRAAVSIERACDDYPNTNKDLGDRYCPALLRIGDVNVRAIYSFRANRFATVTRYFASDDFGRLAEIFVARYGPTNQRKPDVLIWMGKTTMVGLYHYVGTDFTKGYARITTNTEMEESKRLHEEQTKGAAKGL